MSASPLADIHHDIARYDIMVKITRLDAHCHSAAVGRYGETADVTLH